MDFEIFKKSCTNRMAFQPRQEGGPFYDPSQFEKKVVWPTVYWSFFFGNTGRASQGTASQHVYQKFLVF